MYLVHRTAKMALRKRYIRPPQSNEKTNSFAASLQALGSGAPDAPASVILMTSGKKYMFNCGENIGRYSQDMKFSLKKVEQAFFTQSKWNCIGGVTSLIFLTVASSGFPPKFHGPKPLQKIFQRMIFLSSLGGLFKHRFESDAFNTSQLFEDEKVVIKSVELNHLNDVTTIYVCKLKALRGAFSIQRSIQENVPVEFIGRLYKGEDITLDDGRVIKSEDVRHPDMPEIFIICEFIDDDSEIFILQLIFFWDFQLLIYRMQVSWRTSKRIKN